MSSHEYIEVSEPITTNAGTYRVCVTHDPYGPNPREDGTEQLGTIVCQVVRYYPHNTGPREGDLVSVIDDAVERGGWRLAVRYLSTVRGAVVLPIYGTDRLSVGELGEAVDNDSSVSGVIYALRSDIASIMSPLPSDAEIAGWLASEVTQYTAWANDETFGHVIERLTDGCDPECESDQCWSEVDSCGTYYSVEDALAVGRERVPTEAELTDTEWLAQLFEFELCAECGQDADAHTVGLDPLGKRHAWCVDAGTELHYGLSDGARAIIASLVAANSHQGENVDEATDAAWSELRKAFPAVHDATSLAAGLIAECESGAVTTALRHAGYLAIDLDLVTEVEARDVYPDTWVEARPHGVFDEGDIGGDIQAGTAWSRRFVRYVSTTGLWAVITDSFYLAKCDHDEDQREVDCDGDPRCKYCGPVSWIQNQTEYVTCRDFTDPGSTEEGSSDTDYDNTSGDFDYQMTDDFAKWCATRLRVDAHGDPANWR
jgi:hypothetical protein